MIYNSINLQHTLNFTNKFKPISWYLQRSKFKNLLRSRAEVEKQKANMKLRSQASEDAKQEYMDQLRKTNEAQRQHYEQRLPHVFKQLQVKVHQCCFYFNWQALSLFT